ncbi:IS5/IS1182 family transposase [Nocardia nova]|uniref:IS5/IS1182 family transposase n=1 Tax=Nocardia nova TaxID=37330 RepID=A0A2S6AN11_9NOCA|nr:IS5/IS1182 family transposase [Nocardia nova]PPJ36625.1 IS5/IS1182 family transposase [Nocardia nova]
MSVSYVAVLAIPERTVFAVEEWLALRRRDLGTRWRALTCMEHAVLVLRWFTDGTRVEQLALDNAIGLTTCYDALHEAIDVFAARAPGLRGALLAARAAGYEHLDVDGMLVHIDRCSEPGPTPAGKRTSGPNRARIDLWWSGKHHGHGGNVQVVTAPDGWPLWVSAVAPGRTHDITALRADQYMVPLLTEWTADDRKVLADLGYLGVTPSCGRSPTLGPGPRGSSRESVRGGVVADQPPHGVSTGDETADECGTEEPARAVHKNLHAALHSGGTGREDVATFYRILADYLVI